MKTIQHTKTIFLSFICIYFLLLFMCTKQGFSKCIDMNPVYAKRFSVSQCENYKLVHIYDEWDQIIFKRALVHHTAPIPNGFNISEIARIPGKTTLVLETAHLPFIDALGLSDSLIGVGTPNLVTTPRVTSHIQAGKISDIGEDYQWDIPLIQTLHPSFLIIGYQSANLFKNLSVIPFREYEETHPLGKVEWIKLLSLFFNLENQGIQIFNDKVKSYQSAIQKVSEIKQRPTIFSGTPWNGMWYIPGGTSYLGQLFEDAGTHYLFSYINVSNTLAFNSSEIVRIASDSTIWLIGKQNITTLPALFASDPIFTNFSATRTGNVFNYKMHPNGVFLYFEQSAMNPDLEVEDYITIANCSITPCNQSIYERLHFFVQLKNSTNSDNQSNHFSSITVVLSGAAVLVGIGLICVCTRFIYNFKKFSSDEELGS